MKSATAFRVLLAALTASGLAAPAAAQTAPAVPAAASEAQRTPLTRAEYEAMLVRSFEKQDLDRDGYLASNWLRSEHNPEQLAAMDADGDGRISQAEWVAHGMTRAPQQ
ncbi:hypothetical protein [Bordetella genomosp. 1]|uniref:EF-hand domain-containing protein n=1 Tax=Bordetella genomosp. 1 TaxID=1395607 RepID=A0ABX4F2J9_9BORD|nr:hypothetical protein [Bordetella genomosp. 1]OZI67967.1 hypothetical protein CAL27_00400 [Bordetella genomosp. 1]